MNSEIELMEQTFNQMKGKDINVWQDGAITPPVLNFENFDWCFENADLESYIVLFNGETPLKINIESIHSINCDLDILEVVIFMESGYMLQVWCDLE